MTERIDCAAALRVRAAVIEAGAKAETVEG